jgi:exodeoxyribonuclease VII large subunit
VIRDILHRLRDRFPRKVLIWPVAVQGEACAGEVSRAIAGFNSLSPGGALPRPDLLIVARGGGSVEDLWGFNEESVVRAAAASDIPVISAVGHETDTTLIDHAADVRAPTPSAAAELAVPVRLDLLAWLDNQESRLSHALSKGVGDRRQRLRDLARALPRAETLLDTPRQRLDSCAERLPAALTRSVQLRRVTLYETSGALRPGLLRRAAESDRRRLDTAAARLATGALQREVARRGQDMRALSRRLSDAATRQIARWHDRIEAMERLRRTVGYEATLRRGYAVVRGDGRVVKTREAAEVAAALEIEFADGRLPVGGSGKPRAKSAKPGSTTPGQGSLF